MMKCAICGIEIDSIDQAIEEAWIPYAWDGDREQEGPFCGSCSEILMQVDENGEFELKPEYRGKIMYQDGDFIDEKQDGNILVGIVFEYCEN